MSRGLKQLVYGLFYLASFFLVALIVRQIMIPKVMTCTDGARNQGETDIDCGGPCVSCEIKNLSPLRLFAPYKFFALSTGQASLLFGVENANSSHYASSFVYHVNVFDKNGVRIDNIERTSFIGAQERKYIVEAPIITRAANIGSISITFDDVRWQPVSRFLIPTLSLSDIKAEASPSGGIHVNGTVSNGDSTEANDIHVLAVAYNKFGGELFASQTILNSLPGFQNASFTIPFPDDFIFQNMDIARTKVFISNK